MLPGNLTRRLIFESLTVQILPLERQQLSNLEIVVW